jgi:hypothetical protein
VLRSEIPATESRREATVRVSTRMAAGLAVLALVRPVSAGDIKAESTHDFSAKDLAEALGIRWWSYQVHFDKPVKEVSVRPCELRRRRDGTWARKYLGWGSVHSNDESFREVTVGFLLPNDPTGKRYAVKLKSDWSRQEFEQPADFRNTHSVVPSPVTVVDGCLVLAFQPKDYRFPKLEEADFVRVIAIEVKARETTSGPVPVRDP